MRRLIPLALAAAAVLLGATALTSASPAVPVVRCPTVFGIAGQRHRTPSTMAVLGSPASTRGLAAYTNTQEYLIGPAGMRCAGAVGADGGQSIVVWAAGHRRPSMHSRGAGLTLLVDPACAGCKADDACPFFPKLASGLGFPCPTGIPAGERSASVRSTLTEFEDPPGVAGDGWPSGGRLPAEGIVGLDPRVSARFPGVYRSTCTLPAAQHAVCTVSLDDVIARVGGG